jgi:hypothetical protein
MISTVERRWLFFCSSHFRHAWSLENPVRRVKSSRASVVVPVRAPALLRRERRWVRSAFGGEFNAALVAPFNSAE